jgi:hypothetical protein
VAKLTLVADPDGLLLEEQLLETIRGRGFELIPFEDHAAFRFAYESRFRSRWDRGEATDLVVVLRSEDGDLKTLPYDLLKTGRQLSFNLGELFPNLSYPVVASLDPGDLDALDKAQREFPPGISGDNATKDFILQHVFGMAPSLVNIPARLLRDLLQHHYRGQTLPSILDARLIEVLKQKEAFADWPLDRIVPDRTAFLAFLQERWPLFLEQLEAESDAGVHEKLEDYGFELPGPLSLPFDHDDVRVYIAALFQEGLLKPVPFSRNESLEQSWVQAGIENDKTAEKLNRFDALVQIVDGFIPKEGARHQDWIEFALRWAELLVRQNQCGSTLSGDRHMAFKALQKKVDGAFETWISQRFAGLANLPATTPAMVHHIPRYLFRMLQADQQTKIALVVIDGLSMDQWFVVKERLTAGNGNFRMSERGVFAWLPTLTSVSRQALFAGSAPMYFSSSIKGTDREPTLWTRFWLDCGLNRAQIAYAKLKGHKEELKELETVVCSLQSRVLGLVVSKVDKIIHGMALGTAGMHNQIRQWTEGGFLEALFELLLTHRYRIIVTSDHGNIEAKGCGRPHEGAVSDVKGERVRIFEGQGLRKIVADTIQGVHCWPTVGLPEGFLPLFAPARKAFVPENETTVCHGGISVEELIVPLVQIERRKM